VRQLLAHPAATGVRTVIPAPANPFKMWLLPEPAEPLWMRPLLDVPGIEEPWNMPRQKLPQAYWHTGTIDVVYANVIHAGRMSGDRLLPMLVDPRQSVDIDSEADFAAAAARIGQLPCLRPEFVAAAR
jgi:N-acylneuraminate cytidylyltransferase